MIALTKIRDLDLAVAPAAGRPSHLSAASGLVCIGSFIYVVADDELHLGVFPRTGSEPGILLRVFEGVLPDSKRRRKKKKPDLEALALLPAFAECRHGALFALGSGSRDNRRTGVLLGLDAHGNVRTAPRAVDLSPMLARLDDEFPKLNIEGAVVCGDELRLFQRGNKGRSENAIIRYRLALVLDMLGAAAVGAPAPLRIDRFDLGEIDGIPFCFTDAAALPGGDMVFTAVAEDTEDAYEDGPCAGAAIGLADNDGGLRWLRRLRGSCKVEGVDARPDGDLVRLLMVTDADDAGIPAGLFSAEIPMC
jgi:uncharacterized protein DUF6929